MHPLITSKISLQNQTIVAPPLSSSNSPGAPASGSGSGSSSSDDTSSSSSKSNVGAIVGGVIGGIVALAAVVLGTVLYRRRHRSQGIFGVDSEKPETAPYAQPIPFVYESGSSQSTTDDPESRPSRPRLAPVVMTEKARMYAHNRSATDATTAVANTSATTSASPSAPASNPSTGPASSHEPPSSAQSPGISPSEVRDLRHEMENLRRAMQGIGVESLEPPPTYVG